MMIPKNISCPSCKKKINKHSRLDMAKCLVRKEFLQNNRFTETQLTIIKALNKPTNLYRLSKLLDNRIATTSRIIQKLKKLKVISVTEQLDGNRISKRLELTSFGRFVFR